MQYEILDELPSTGPMPELFSHGGLGSRRHGLVVQFSPGSGAAWVGSFQPGHGGLNRVLRHPNGRDILVIAGGEVYVINPETRESADLWDGQVDMVLELEERRVILGNGFGFCAVGEAGVLWRTRRISWDGMRAIRASERHILGEAWRPADDRWFPFSVDLASGEVEGGSYDDPVFHARRPVVKAWIGRHPVLLSFLALVLVYILWHATPYSRGMLMAEIDCLRGHYEMKSAGLLGPGAGRYRQLLEERYGVRVDGMAGCMVSWDLSSYIDGYNRVAGRYLRGKYEKDIFQECLEAATTEWSQREKKSAPEDAGEPLQ